ncbi:hypothetical protein [Mesorhizobium sp. WSM2239]|uniref:Uncharacterized protein n=2 Tax=unclassified Mesorhizobium TaxID=325217 RepID=A0AAU8D6S9_9HYPH
MTIDKVLPKLAKEMPKELPPRTVLYIAANTVAYKIFRSVLCTTVEFARPALVDLKRQDEGLGCEFFGVWNAEGAKNMSLRKARQQVAVLLAGVPAGCAVMKISGSPRESLYPAHDIAELNDGRRRDATGVTGGIPRRGPNSAFRNDGYAVGPEGLPLRSGNGLQMLARNASDLRVQCENPARAEQRLVSACHKSREKGRDCKKTDDVLRGELAHGRSAPASAPRLCGSGRRGDLAFRRVDPALHPVNVA